MLHFLHFVPPTQNENGTPLAATDICGYEARVDGGQAVSLTNGTLLADGRMEFPIEQLGLADGTHLVEVRTATKDARRSVWAGVSVTQAVLPNPPTLLTAD